MVHLKVARQPQEMFLLKYNWNIIFTEFFLAGNWHSRASIIVGKRVLTPILWRPPILPTPHAKVCPTPAPPPSLPPHFQILSNLPPSLSSPTPTLTALSVVLFLWLNWWSHHIYCATLFNDVMDLHMSSLGNLVPEGLWYMFYALRCQVYWGLTHMVFCWYSDLISHTH